MTAKETAEPGKVRLLGLPRGKLRFGLTASGVIIVVCRGYSADCRCFI